MRNSSTIGGSSSQNRQSDIDARALDILGDRAATLAWEQRVGNVEILQGGTNASILTDFKGSIVKLWDQFFSGKTNVNLTTDVMDQLQKRLLLLEHEVDGLLKRRIMFSVKDTRGGERVMDYTGLLNEKQIQIVELEKKIQNFEERLRRASKREQELESQIDKLRGAMSSLDRPNVTRGEIESILLNHSEYRKLQQKYDSLQGRFSGFAGILKGHSEKLRSQGITFQHENELNRLVTSEGLSAFTVNGVLSLGDYQSRVVEVPVSDARTKHLIHMLAVQMKKFVEKYPKLLGECDARLVEFFQQELIDVIEVDEIDRLVEIVKYVPEVVKVENVYAYSSEKSRRVEFHLRVLVKALLEELERMKMKTGMVLELDEGVIGMIKAEILDIVNVDDILKIFRVVPKIVEVQKVIEKIVDRVIEIPQVVPVERMVEKIVEVIKVLEVEKIVHVPVEIVKIVEIFKQKIVPVITRVEIPVEVPCYRDVIVEKIVEVIKEVHNEVIVEKIVEIEVPKIVEKIVHVPIVQYETKEIIVEKIVLVKTVEERIVQKEVFIDNIVQTFVYVPQLVTVDRRNDVLVKQIEVQNAREVVNHIQKVPEIIEVIIERPVPLIQTVERIVEVPRIIEKIVEVKVYEQIIKEVKVPVKEYIEVIKLKEVEVIVYKEIEVIREIEKIVQKFIEIPIIHERIVKVPEIITQIAVETIEKPVIVEVEVFIDRVVQVPKIIEIEKPIVVQYMQQVPVKVIVEKIVEVPKTIERIKEVRVNIDKIIEKMVEVPKVVEVEKIVEKIVVVPRVIEKIVEVPQFIEVVVDRIVIETQIQTVERIVEVPMISEVPKEKEVVVNHYIYEPKIHEIVKEKIVPAETVKTVPQEISTVREKIVEVVKQIPREIKIDNIVIVVKEVAKVVPIEKTIMVPVEVPIPIDRIVEVPVPLIREVEKIVEVIQEVEKIVEVKCEEIRIERIPEKEVQIIEKEIYREIKEIVPVKETVIEVVTLIEQKIILNNVEVEKIKPIDRYIEKLAIQRSIVEQAKEVEKKVDYIIEKTKVVTIENEQPIMVECPVIIESFRDRVHVVPIIQKIFEEIKVIEEKIVSVERNEVEIKEIEVFKDRVIEQEKLIVKTDINNHIETRIDVVDRYQDNIIPITTCTEKIVQVPYIIEKIVEKIVIMPQIVEVIKYVHEIVEQETLGVAVGVDVRVQQAKYQELYGKVKPQFELILIELRKLRTTNPAFKIQIDLIENFLVELSRLVAFPKIVQIQKEKIVEVEKDRPVLVAKLDLEAQRFQVTLSMIVSKLLGELISIKESNPNIKFNIDGEILKMFSNQFREKSGLLDINNGGLQKNLSKVYSFYDNFLGSIGGSALSNDSQLMFTAALEERLLMTSLIEQANLQIRKAQEISKNRGEAFRVILQSYNDIIGKFGNLETNVLSFAMKDQGAVKGEMAKFKEIISTAMVSVQSLGSVQPVKGLSIIGSSISYDHASYLDPHLVKFAGNLDNDIVMRLQGAFRSLEKENQLLKDKYVNWQSGLHKETHDHDRIINELQKKIVDQAGEINSYRAQSSVNVNVSGNSEAYERQIQTLNNKIRELDSKLRQTSVGNTSSTTSQEYEAKIRELESKLRQSSVGNTSSSSTTSQEYEIKIRTLSSKIQEVESQLRTSKVEYEGQIRNKDKVILELEGKVKVYEERLSKGGDSRATGIGKNSYTPSSINSSMQDRMSSSQHSATGSQASDSQLSDKSGVRQYGNYATSSYSKGGNVQGASSGLSGSGASYGQGSSLSGSGANYSQSGQTGQLGQSGQSGYTRTYQSGGSTGVSGTSAVSGSSAVQGSSATYGQGQGSSTSASNYTRTYGTSGISGTGQSSSGKSGSNYSRYQS